MDWKEAQKNSSIILSDGAWRLKQSDSVRPKEIPSEQGIYLLSANNKDYYVGIAANLQKRIKQQFSSRSTFYSNYLKKIDVSNDDRLDILDFELRYLEVRIGRKELEEFCMVNLRTPLNKFHKNKRSEFEVKYYGGLWDTSQEKWNSLVPEGEEYLFSATSVKWNEVQINGGPGIYFVNDSDGRLIYVGESTNVQRRHHMHTNRTYISALRRHIGTQLLGFAFIKKKEFSAEDEGQVGQFLSNCTFAYQPVQFGRVELEEALIKKRMPTLNRKSK